MLPITNHKVIHVPHALAVIAALIGLLAALSWDYHVNDSDASVISQPMVSADAASSDDMHGDNSDAAESSTPSSGSGGGQAWGAKNVLPLLLPISQDPQ